MYRDSIAKAMVGRGIATFEIAGDRESVTFTMDEGKPVRLEVSADCCSSTWIESVDDPGALRGRVLAVEEVEMPDLGNVDGVHRKDCYQVAYYGLKITTENGRALIDYRNDSNGYYGGSLELA